MSIYTDLFKDDMEPGSILGEPTDLHPLVKTKQEQIEGFVSRRAPIWKADPALLHADITRFARYEGICVLTVMTVVMSWVSRNMPMNKLLQRQRITCWSSAQLWKFVPRTTTFHPVLQKSLDTATDYAYGQVKEYEMRVAYGRAREVCESFGRTVEKVAKEEHAYGNEKVKLHARFMCMLELAKAAMACCDLEYSNGEDFFVRGFCHNVEHARWKALGDTGNPNAGMGYGIDVAWCYLRELGLLLRV